jgi:hypothetical protein
MLAKNTKKFYLLEDYHGGADGRVWLACNGSGRLLVLKLSKDRSYEQEAQRWRDIWDVSNVSTISLMSSHAHLMPFAFHGILGTDGKIKFRCFSHWTAEDEIDIGNILTSEAKEIFDEEQLRNWYENPLLAAETAIRDMALKGYEHADLWW